MGQSNNDWEDAFNEYTALEQNGAFEKKRIVFKKKRIVFEKKAHPVLINFIVVLSVIFLLLTAFPSGYYTLLFLYGMIFPEFVFYCLSCVGCSFGRIILLSSVRNHRAYPNRILGGLIVIVAAAPVNIIASYILYYKDIGTDVAWFSATLPFSVGFGGAAIAFAIVLVFWVRYIKRTKVAD